MVIIRNKQKCKHKIRWSKFIIRLKQANRFQKSSPKGIQTIIKINTLIWGIKDLQAKLDRSKYNDIIIKKV